MRMPTSAYSGTLKHIRNLATNNMTDTEVINRLRELGWNPTDENPVEITFRLHIGVIRTVQGIRICPEGMVVACDIPQFGNRDRIATVLLMDEHGKQNAPHNISNIYAFDKREEILCQIADYEKRIKELKEELN
jgi:hypothetical protein